MLGAGAGAVCLLAWPLFRLVRRHDTDLVLPAQFAFAVTLGLYLGVVPSVLAEASPRHLRCGGFAVAYNLSLAVFGGMSPMVFAYLIARARRHGAGPGGGRDGAADPCRHPEPAGDRPCAAAVEAKRGCDAPGRRGSRARPPWDPCAEQQRRGRGGLDSWAGTRPARGLGGRRWSARSRWVAPRALPRRTAMERCRFFSAVAAALGLTRAGQAAPEGADLQEPGRGEKPSARGDLRRPRRERHACALTTTNNSLVIRSGEALGGGTTVNVDLAFSPLLPYIQQRVAGWSAEGLVDGRHYTRKKIADAYRWVTSNVPSPRSLAIAWLQVFTS